LINQQAALKNTIKGAYLCLLEYFLQDLEAIKFHISTDANNSLSVFIFDPSCHLNGFLP